MAFVLFGYDQGVFGGILQNENWLDQFGHPADTKTGIIVSSYNLGCLTGCISEFFLGMTGCGDLQTVFRDMMIIKRC